jgi:predicted dehydrogenase
LHADGHHHRGQKRNARDSRYSPRTRSLAKNREGGSHVFSPETLIFSFFSRLRLRRTALRTQAQKTSNSGICIFLRFAIFAYLSLHRVFYCRFAPTALFEFALIVGFDEKSAAGVSPRLSSAQSGGRVSWYAAQICHANGKVKMHEINRRNFLKSVSAASATTMLGERIHALAAAQSEAAAPVAANDHVQIALIGAGGQGQDDTRVALQVPGVKLVAVADCYDGRLARSKEIWGSEVFTTRDYKEILERKDIDAVLIATPDHWHKQAALDAMKAGKDVYCEKPMIHLYADGPEMIETARSTGRILQIGSQRVSSVIYAKAKELLASGAIGQLNMVTARWDRNSAIGAWDYSIPPDASPATCDWPRFLGTAPKIPFNAEHFFQWRKWKAYGSGVAGDLFVHLFSGTHFITGSNGPTRAMATGGLRFWKDGRDAADVMLGLFDYREGFNLSLRVNFVDGGEESEGLIFTGSEGTMEIAGNTVSVNRVPRETEPGYTIGTFTEAMQKEFLEQYRKQYPKVQPDGPASPGYEKYQAPAGYSDSYDHFKNFFASVRTRQQPVEDAVFGFRAAGAALLSNLSMDRGAIVNWNPDTMNLV